MIYEFFAEGFEELEAIAPLDLLRRAGVPVQSVAVGESKTITGSHGIAITCDLPASELDMSSLTGVILPGGPGHKLLAASPVVKEALAIASEQNGLLAAICAAPSVLGKYGYLEGKRACCFPGFEESLSGASISYDPVVRDGNVITSRGAGTAAGFALELVAYLISPEKAQEISAQIQKI